MPEGSVHRCSWERAGERIRIWLISDPQVCGEGDTLAAAQVAMMSAVCDAFGDGEAVWTYDKPAPLWFESDAPYRVPHLVTIVGNTRPDPSGSAEGLYADGVCGDCGMVRGARTQLPRSVPGIEPGYEGGFFHGPETTFFSERFVSVLPVCARLLEWRSVVVETRTARSFLELVGPMRIPFVGVNGLQADGWRCASCGHRSFGHWKETGISEFVCSSDLPDPLPPCFVVGSADEPRLCMPLDVWLALSGRPEASGIVNSDLGVVPPSICVREPDLPLREPRRARRR